MNLIINADDFGLTGELNHCVQHLHSKGVLPSTTIIANSPFFSQAVDIAKSSPGLGVGIHLCLDGPFNMKKGPSSLVDPESGKFYDHLYVSEKLKKYKFNPADIFEEYDLQMQKVLDHGIKITHIDHHHHFHLYHQSLKQIIKISKKYNIRSIRSQIILLPVSPGLVNSAYRRTHQFFVKKSFKVPDGYFELLSSSMDPYELNLERLRRLLSSNYNTIEIECHPNNENYFDTLFLGSPEVLELLKEHTVINFTNI
jgi:chitin disaccharide deacetylase